MIDVCETRARAARELWSGHVRKIFQTLNLHERETAREISESLAVFCEQHPHMTDRSLSLLMARSFCASGDHDAADQVLRHDRVHGPHADSWLEVLSSEYPFPGLYPLFSSRALRPLRLKTVGQETSWVLDLGKIHFAVADRHEIILMQTLRALTETASNVWTRTDGQGTLVVKGLSRISDLLYPNQNRAMSQALDFLQDILQHRAARAGWSFVPSVLLLDL